MAVAISASRLANCARRRSSSATACSSFWRRGGFGREERLLPSTFEGCTLHVRFGADHATLGVCDGRIRGQDSGFGGGDVGLCCEQPGFGL
ncbi:MAG: hypothetical protein WDO18_19895 [Acidobacteriota bacterium]